jgi:hypothetical protein
MKRANDQLEAFIVIDYCYMVERLCRLAMIRNCHFSEWFTATVKDEIIRYYVFPVLELFGIRYWKFFDCEKGRNGSKTGG